LTNCPAAAKNSSFRSGALAVLFLPSASLARDRAILLFGCVLDKLKTSRVISV
jgi:hypothetical protein